MIIDDILSWGCGRSSEAWWCETEKDKNETIAFAIAHGVTYDRKELISYQSLGNDKIDVFQIARNSQGKLVLLVGFHRNHFDAQTWQDFKEKYNIDIQVEHIALSGYLMGVK